MNPPAASNRRILVVDDNRSIQADFKKILTDPRPAGPAGAMEAALFGTAAARPPAVRYELDMAQQGLDALEMVRRAVAGGRPYAMAFMDVRMPPGWDGIETTAHLWELDPAMQIVLCTAYSDYSWDEMHAKLGVSDQLVILKKPFDNIEVLQLATTLTEKWNLAHQLQSRLAALEHTLAEQSRELCAAREAAAGRQTGSPPA